MSEQPKPCCDLSVQHTHGSLRADGTFTPDQPPVSAQTMVLRVEYDFSPPLNESELRAFVSTLPPIPRRTHINPPDTVALIEQQAARIAALEQELRKQDRQITAQDNDVVASWKAQQVAEARCTEQAEEIARLTATVEALIAESKASGRRP